jgi:cell division protease FtsH
MRVGLFLLGISWCASLKPPESFNKALSLRPYLYEKTYSNLISDINSEKLSTIYLSPSLDSAILENRIREDNELLDYSIVRISPILVNDIVEKSVTHHVEPVFISPPGPNQIQTLAGEIVQTINVLFLPFLIITILVNVFRSSMGNGSPLGGSGGNPFMPGLSKINFKGDKERLKKANVTLKSFAGSPEIFEECSEVVSYLKNATLYKAAGAEIPRGILLEGPPGTGKTLLAKSIASEADANFVSISASEFVEVFVGLGASKVRSIFKQARENKPCILFIDEIDSVGKQRGSNGFNTGNDEREQTLNQLLAEMDGFAENDGILIIAATNRKDTLDAALLRPGRFDRIITVALPDKNSRKDIFQVHSKNKAIEPTINVELIAELTSGFSGAQIKNLLNEAAIYAARKGQTVIQEVDILNALEKLVVGLIRKVDTRSEDTRIRVALHELGHAICCSTFPEYFDLKKISIQSTYSGAGGYTLFNEHANITEGGMYTKDIFMKRLIVTMGGKAAERVYYGEPFVSVGAIQDLKEANNLANRMIRQFGMGTALETYSREIDPQQQTSDRVKSVIDEESMNLVNEAYIEAIHIIKNQSEKMNRTLTELLQKNTIYKV